jgi:hypothetical protein
MTATWLFVGPNRRRSMVILRGAYTPRILRYAAAVAESGMKSSAGKYDTALLGSSKVKLTSEQTQKDDRPHHDESRQDFTPENVDAPSLDGSPRSAAGSQKVRGRSRDHMCDIFACLITPTFRSIPSELMNFQGSIECSS